MADKVSLVFPVMGQQGPDRARHLARQSDDDHVRGLSSGQAQYPFARLLAVNDCCSGAVYQQGARIPLAPLGDSEHAHPAADPDVVRRQTPSSGKLPTGSERRRRAQCY